MMIKKQQYINDAIFYKIQGGLNFFGKQMK